jgi:hypothetical protein
MRPLIPADRAPGHQLAESREHQLTEPRGTQLALQHKASGIRIDANTVTTPWRGERMDYGLAIEVLLVQSRRTMEHSRGNVTVD